jgi:hypothetical protein
LPVTVWRALPGHVSIGGEPDPKIAHEILRSRRLGELLWSRPPLVSEFMGALRRAPDISARIEEEIVRLTTEAVDASRAKSDRVQLRRILTQLGSGDVLLVTRLDRLAARALFLAARSRAPTSSASGAEHSLKAARRW